MPVSLLEFEEDTEVGETILYLRLCQILNQIRHQKQLVDWASEKNLAGKENLLYRCKHFQSESRMLKISSSLIETQLWYPIIRVGEVTMMLYMIQWKVRATTAG